MPFCEGNIYHRFKFLILNYYGLVCEWYLECVVVFNSAWFCCVLFSNTVLYLHKLLTIELLMYIVFDCNKTLAVAHYKKICLYLYQ